MIAGVAFAGFAGAQSPSPGELATDNPDTAILIVPTAGGKFFVSLRTSVAADCALITVYYKRKMLVLGDNRNAPEGVTIDTLESRESVAPVAAGGAYGSTRDDFDMAQATIRYISVTFLQRMGMRQTPVATP